MQTCLIVTIVDRWDFDRVLQTRVFYGASRTQVDGWAAERCNELVAINEAEGKVDPELFSADWDVLETEIYFA